MMVIDLRTTCLCTTALVVFSFAGCTKSQQDANAYPTDRSASAADSARYSKTGAGGVSNVPIAAGTSRRASAVLGGDSSGHAGGGANCGTTGATGLTDSESDTTAGGMASGVISTPDLSDPTTLGQPGVKKL